MSISLRIIFIIATILTFVYMWIKVSKSQVRIQDLFSWIIIGFGLVLLAIFPEIVSTVREWLGFVSDTNVVFLGMIFLLLIISFRQMVRISIMKNEIQILTQKMAITNNEISKEKE